MKSKKKNVLRGHQHLAKQISGQNHPKGGVSCLRRQGASYHAKGGVEESGDNYLPANGQSFHLSFPLIKHGGVWQGLDEASEWVPALRVGLDQCKVSPRPEIPAFCENTDVPTFTVSPKFWCPGIWQTVPGQCPRLYPYTFQNFKHSQANRRSQSSCPSSPLNTGGRVTPPSSCPSPHSSCCALFSRGSTQPPATPLSSG